VCGGVPWVSLGSTQAIGGRPPVSAPRHLHPLIHSSFPRFWLGGCGSGDTGPSALEAVRGRGRVRVLVLYPKGRTSNTQVRHCVYICLLLWTMLGDT
jgi:hypothetical protein